MSLRLHVQSPGGEADYEFDGPEVVVGRSGSAGLSLVDSRVSRQHARLTCRGDGWWLEDLGARNGTQLNGALLTAAARLHAGDDVRVGDSTLRVVSEGGRTAPAVAATTRVVPAGDDAARLWTIAEIHKALAAPVPLGELLDLVLARCFDVLGPEEGAIVLRGKDGELATAASRRADGTATPVAVPRRLIEEVAGKARPTLVLDAMLDDRFAGSQSMVSSGVRCIVAAPLTDAEGTLGLITLGSRVALRQFTKPDLDMLTSIASAAALRLRNAALAEEIAARRVLEYEMTLAHDVQMSMLPREPPACRALQVGMRLRPARSVGGDLYDFTLDGDRLWFIVADVAGKSIAAALYVAIVKTLFRALAGGETDVAAVAARMNDALSRDNHRLTFVTCVVGCLETRTGALSFVDAGHTPVILAGAHRAEEVAAVPKNPAMGVLGGAAYGAAHLSLDPESILAVYTDGFTEARNAAGEMFGVDRVCAAARGASTPADLVAAVLAAVDRFAAAAPQEDDLAIFALQWSPLPSA